MCKDGKTRVRNRIGEDLTDAFVNGARQSYREAVERAEALGEPIEGAILKARSPSCGVGRIYDGTFSGQLIPGNGLFAQILIGQGIPVMTESELKERQTND